MSASGTLYVVRCTLYVVRCTLYVVRCTLYVVRCTEILLLLFVYLPKRVSPSVSNPVYTDTGIPVFRTPNTDTSKNLPVFAGIENV
jgi:hypothetical protein